MSCSGVDCLTFAADVRDDAAVSNAVESTVARFGRIDILFNNAGICGYGLAHELTEDAWDAMLDINLKGAWIVARRIIPHMIARRSGVILNNLSVAGLRGMARLSHYAASKSGEVIPWRGRSRSPLIVGIPESRGSSRIARRRGAPADRLPPHLRLSHTCRPTRQGS